MRIEADLQRCSGTANCMALAPEVFDVGDDDLVKVLIAEVPPEHLKAVEDAVRRCPQGALRPV
jgi:ferredoxin